MGNKKFISFLGTNFYNEAKYFYQNSEKIKENRFVQIAIYDLICQDFTEEDEIIILVTEDSYKKNWKDYDKEKWQGKLGLEKEFEQLSPRAKITVQKVVAPNEEEDVRALFDTIVGLINEKDEMIFDITHGYRSFGVVVMSIANYLRTAKNANIIDILYGAYLSGQELTPIVSLSSILDIEAWTHAIGSFLETGNPDAMNQLANQEKDHAFIHATEDKDIILKLSNVADKLNKLFDSLMKTRSTHILTNYRNLEASLKLLDEFIEKDYRNHPLIPMVNKIKQLLMTKHQEENIIIILYLVKDYLLYYDYYQPATTIAQELVLSWIGEKLGFTEADLKEEELRNQIQVSILHINNPRKNESIYSKQIEDLFGEENAKEFAKHYQNLNELRNDLNHAGTKKNLRNSNTIHSNAQDSIDGIINLIENKVLLNVTSHQLTDVQISDAKKNWSVRRIDQLPDAIQTIWSNIDPSINSDEINLNELYSYIQDHYQPSQLIILAQGELSATTKLVNWAQKRNITIINSTTERRSVDQIQADGSVETVKQFQHVRFREYPKGE